MERHNWAGNYCYRAARGHAPHTVEQVQELVARCQRVKVVGSRHSFNDIADTTADMISLAALNQVVALDRERLTVTIESGIRYGTLCQWLNREGYALHNLASLPHISVAGACATATHGSGDKNRNLAAAVSALELVTAEGEVREFSRERDGEIFEGMVVGLGGLGLVTKLTLKVEPTFTMRQIVYENLPLAQLEAHFDSVMSRAYSVSLFTDWQDPRFNQVWLKERIADDALSLPEPIFFGATLATRPLHPLADHDAKPCTEQMGIPGAWYERLPHFRMEFTPSNGAELQSEYLVPRENALDALRAIYALREQIAPHLLISEVRTIAADDFWMSPCYQQNCVGIHFTWKLDWAAVKPLLPTIEATLSPFHARPHWGKLFAMEAAQLQPLYPKLLDFQRLLQEFDPHGKFYNDYLERCILGPAPISAH